MNINENINIISKNTKVNTFDKVFSIIKNIKEKIGTGNIIGLYVDKSVEMILLIYGILLSSNIYLPLDKSYPINKIQFYISQANCKYIITDTDHNFNDSKLLNINDLLKKKNNIKNYNFTFNDISYILFTSGTTGNPKGTINKYSSLINHMKWLVETFDFDSKDIILQKTPISFDASTWEIYLPLFTKLKMFVSENEDHKDPKKLASIIVENKINIIQIVPSVGEYLFDEIKKLDINYKLKYIFCGGEALSFKLADKLSEISQNVINLYGPSECCCNTIFYKYKKTDYSKYNSLYCPIGNPIKNTQIKILNEQDNIGELVISGDAVGLGYINNETLTSEKFDTINNILYYKTGDIVKINLDKTLTFCNRIDTQVKINGQRIELDEVKDCIYEHPLVKECQIIITKKIIMCAVTPINIDINILQNICNSKLETFKRPGIYKTFESFPRLNNGKTDINRIINDLDIVKNNEVLTHFEKKIIKIISEVGEINKDLISKKIELDYLGIDSLKKYVLSNRISKELKLNITPKECTSLKSIVANKNKDYIDNIDIEYFTNNFENIINKSEKIIAIHSSLVDFNLDLIKLKKFMKELILKKVSEGYTFLFPSFNYSFCSNNYYHYKYSSSEVGILSEWILELNESMRTNNPIFSWVIIGPRKYDILKCDNSTCFGKKSVFDYLYQNNSSYILLGCKHFTQIHYCEEKANIDWRFYKDFKGLVNFGNENKEFKISMYCRKLEGKSKLEFSYFNIIKNKINTNKIGNGNIYSFITTNICDILINSLSNGNLKPI